MLVTVQPLAMSSVPFGMPVELSSGNQMPVVACLIVPWNWLQSPTLLLVDQNGNVTAVSKGTTAKITITGSKSGIVKEIPVTVGPDGTEYVATHEMPLTAR